MYITFSGRPKFHIFDLVDYWLDSFVRNMSCKKRFYKNFAINNLSFPLMNSDLNRTKL